MKGAKDVRSRIGQWKMISVACVSRNHDGLLVLVKKIKKCLTSFKTM